MAGPKTTTDDKNAEPDAPRSLLRRLLDRAPTDRKRLLFAAGGVVLLIGAVATPLLLRDAEVKQQTATVEMALAALDDGRFPEARQLAEALGEGGMLSSETSSGRSFVLGAVLIAEAKNSWSDPTPNFLLAAKHLEASRDRGFPEGREAEGYFLLGEALHDSGQYVQSRRWLREALNADPRRSKELHRLLSSSYRNDPNPKWSLALEHNSQLLAEPSLRPSERNDALLERSQLLYELGQIDACRETLTQIGQDARNRAEAMLMQGRLQLDEARRLALPESPATTPEIIQQKYEHAVQSFRTAQGQATLGSQATRKALYLIGVCLAEMPGQQDAAIDQLSRTRRIYPGTPEAVAASLLEGDLYRSANRAQEAAEAYAQALQSAGDPLVYSNPWVALDELIHGINEAYLWFLEHKQFSPALAMLDSYPPLFPNDQTVQLRAETHQAWGDSLLAEALQLPPSARGPIELEARKQYIKAGFGYSNLARLHTTSRIYPEDIWRSGQAFMFGHDFINATQVLNIYLRYENREHRPAALVAFGQASMALGKTEQAIDALRACIDFHPRDVAVYEARIWCSKAYRDIGEFEEAEELLTTNLRLSGLEPSSPEWRESLYELGLLMHEDGRYAEAIETLQEAVDRERLHASDGEIPYTPQVVRALYTIAEAYRLRAEEPRQRLLAAEVENDRQVMQRQLTRTLNDAALQYTQLRALLNRRQEDYELTDLDQALLRNCYFSLGSVLFDMGRYEEAIKAYSDAEARYQNDPLVLEIFVQVASCYSRMNRDIEARGAIARAQVVWNGLPEAGPYLETTNYTRDQWRDLLDQLSRR